MRMARRGMTMGPVRTNSLVRNPDDSMLVRGTPAALGGQVSPALAGTLVRPAGGASLARASAVRAGQTGAGSLGLQHHPGKIQGPSCGAAAC